MKLMNVQEATLSISVIVCTRNRCHKLARALRSIDSAKIPANIAAELIVVDNNSSDRTREVVAEFSRESNIPVRYVVETSQGLCFARNRGIQESSAEILAFTDDDCVADANWITNISNAFLEAPNLAVVGGRVDLYSQDDRPVSIRPLNEPAV